MRLSRQDNLNLYVSESSLAQHWLTLLEQDHESRQWKRTGEFITTVEADSALLQLPDYIEDKVPLHADHSTIVKFDSRNAAGYRTALGKLKQFEKDAPAVVAARFSMYLQNTCHIHNLASLLIVV
jgi:hypothetical protein